MMKKNPFTKKKASEPSSAEDNNDGFVARRSNRVTDSKFNQSDGDTWQETLAVCEINDVLCIRSYYTNRRTDQRVWDEPPSGASNIKEASEEMRKMAKVQLSEMKIVTGQVDDLAEVKKKGGIGGLFRRKNKDTLSFATIKATTNKEGKKVHPRIQYKSDSFIAESKKNTSKELFFDHGLQQALAASIAESTGHTKGTIHGETEQYNYIQKYHDHDDDLELALAISMSDSRPQQETKEEDGLDPPVPASSHVIDRSESPYRCDEEHSAQLHVRSKSHLRHVEEPSMQHDARKRPQEAALEQSMHFRGQSNESQQYAVNSSTHRQFCDDSDLEMALALSLSETTKRSGLKDPPLSTPVTKIINSETLAPLDHSEISDHYRFMKFSHKVGPLGSEDEAAVMALAISTTGNIATEIEDKKPAAKRSPTSTSMKLTKNNILEVTNKKPATKHTPTPTSILHTQSNTTEIEAKNSEIDCG